MARFVTSKQNKETRNRTYFRKDHQNEMFLQIVSVWFKRRIGDHVAISYKLANGVNARCPAGLSRWLDDKDDLFIEHELREWKKRVNTEFDVTSISCQPPFYQRHLNKFLDFLKRNAQPRTQEKYKAELERYAFPFFVAKLDNHKPETWKQHYHEWYGWLEERRKKVSGHKRAVVALRRYLEFLKAHTGNPDIILPDSRGMGKHEKKSIPGGEIPSFDRALVWLRELAPGRDRWTISIMTVFGLRISEALVTTSDNLIDNSNVEEFKRQPFIQSIFDKHINIYLLTHVYQAKKRKLADEDLKKRYSKEVEISDPKTRKYIAGCFHQKCAEFLVELINNKEDEGHCTEDTVYRAMKASSDPLFCQYAPHDLRRLNITLQALHTHDLFAISKLHGHANEDVTRRYYQEATYIKMKQGNRGRKLELISAQ